MKHAMYLSALALAVGMGAATAAHAAEEIDHNIIPGVTDVTEAPAVAEDVPEVPAPAAAPAVKKEKPAKAAKMKEPQPEPRDIPTIDTDNAATSADDVSYVTGGIGEDEKKAIEDAKADYNLYVMSASTSGAFVGDAHVTIRRVDGKMLDQVLDVVAGPLLYVRLPAGNYVLEATLGTQTKRQPFTVSSKGRTAHVHLGWKVAADAVK